MIVTVVPVEAAPVLVEAAAAAVPVLTAAHSYHNQGIHSSFECLGLVHWVHHSYNLHYPAVGIGNSCSHYTGCWHHAEKPVCFEYYGPMKAELSAHQSDSHSAFGWLP